MGKFSVSQLINDRGNAANNQFVINGVDEKTGFPFVGFQSYDSPIAKVFQDGSITVGKNWDYSTTTAKHFAIFLRDYASTTYPGRAAFQKMIDNGQVEYQPEMSW